MLDEIKKPLEDLVASGKKVLENAVKSDEGSDSFFEKLSERIARYTGHKTVPNEKLKYNKSGEDE
ncbi:MAG: hypothetical protein IKR00_01760 [Lachnospiraceae bacterium]|nr:hypothetical protein [Lachnospiraceae bacterium]